MIPYGLLMTIDDYCFGDPPVLQLESPVAWSFRRAIHPPTLSGGSANQPACHDRAHGGTVHYCTIFLGPYFLSAFPLT